MAIRVCYVDDEPDLRELFFDLFDSDEIQVRVFGDPREAIAAMLQDPPDLAVLDHRLPGMTGDELAQRLDPELPKILLTGEQSLTPVARFTALVEKPYKPDRLRELMIKAVVR